MLRVGTYPLQLGGRAFLRRVGGFGVLRYGRFPLSVTFAMHYFENFKGFSSSQLNLLRPLTVLVGPNGAGKSNVIEGIELLSFIARGRFLHEISELGRGGDGLEVRGGLNACVRFGSDAFTLGFGAHINFQGERRGFKYKVTLSREDVYRIHSESLLFDDGTVIFETIPSGPGRISGDISVSYNNFRRGKYKPQVSVAANRSVLSQYKQFATRNAQKVECDKLVDAVVSHLRASFVFDPKPSLMRQYEKIGDDLLQRNGSNLSSVLYGLSLAKPIDDLFLSEAQQKSLADRSSQLKRLRDWICFLPDEEFTDFDFVTTRLSDVIFGLKTKRGDSLVDASLLSDGTLRSLAFLTALETVQSGSRVVMEEFDNGVHPSRVNLLVKALAETSARRKLNVLVTTHNPATLNVLAGSQLDGVTFSVWDKKDGSYRLADLRALPRLPEFLEGGDLGDLVTRRVVEQYLSPHFTDEQRVAVSAWMDRLQ